jgi:uncharacterized membrane protein
MSLLIAVIFPYATTASAAAEHVRQMEGDLAPDPGALAVVSCDDQGEYWITTNHPGDADAGRASLWFLLLNALVLVPSADTLGDIGRRTLGTTLAQAGIDPYFQRGLSEGLGPDSSALFLLLDAPPGDGALDALRRFAGTVHMVDLAPGTETLVAQALRAAGADVGPAVGVARAAAAADEPRRHDV